MHFLEKMNVYFYLSKTSTVLGNDAKQFAVNLMFAIESKLSNAIPTINIEPESFFGPALTNTFSMFPVTAIEIKNEITSLSSAKATGPYSIPVGLLKLIKSYISTPLELIYNHSFSSGIVPDQFKLANVIPINKKDSTTCLDSYRPIS